MTLDLPVVVLCGGLGTRLRQVVRDRPKALAPVGEEPFLAVQLRLLRDRGARQFVLCVGHMANQIEAAFGDGSSLGVRIDYVRDGEQLLGTAGAIKQAERFFIPAAIVVNGDTYIDVNLADLARTHAASGAVATLTLARVEDARRYGRVDFDGDRVIAFREKDPCSAAGGWINAGVYVLGRELLARVPPDVPASLERDVFPDALRDGQFIAAFTQDETPHDIGTPDAFRDFVARRSAGTFTAS